MTDWDSYCETVLPMSGNRKPFVYIVRWQYFEGSHIVGIYDNFEDAKDKESESRNHVIEKWEINGKRIP